jgi:hypothetical protein
VTKQRWVRTRRQAGEDAAGGWTAQQVVTKRQVVGDDAGWVRWWVDSAAVGGDKAAGGG